MSQYAEVYNVKTLKRAWRRVRQNGLSKNASDKTRQEVLQFSKDSDRHIRRIYDQLRQNRFKILPGTGVPIPKPGKDPRPIIIIPVEDRVVRRAILDVLHEEPSVQAYINVPTSFGAIKRTDPDDDSRYAVAGAIEQVVRNIEAGKTFYIRSDIENFFTKIPRDVVIEKIAQDIADKKFMKLFEEAITAELANMEELGVLLDLFPGEVGVAQGCCLSPLIGNILLSDFDSKMNNEDIACIRYMDDIVLLGKGEEAVTQAFETSKSVLQELGLTLYEPEPDSEKAFRGVIKPGIKGGMDFLSCNIISGMIRPSKNARAGIMDKINSIYKASDDRLRSGVSFERQFSYVETVSKVSRTYKGWCDHYKFCNDMQTFSDLDGRMKKRFATYRRRVAQFRRKLPANMRYRVDGLYLASHGKTDPIRWNSIQPHEETIVVS